MHYVVYDTATSAFIRGTGFDPRIPEKDGTPRMSASESVIEVEDSVWTEANEGQHTFKIESGVLVVTLDIPVLVKQYDDAMQQHLTATRVARGYTVREPDKFLGSSVPRWNQDAIDWVAFRDSVMLYGLQVQNDYAEGKDVPALAIFKTNMPQITWTYQEQT